MTGLDKSKVGNFGQFWSKLKTNFEDFQTLEFNFGVQDCFADLFWHESCFELNNFLIDNMGNCGPFFVPKACEKSGFFSSRNVILQLEELEPAFYFQAILTFRKKWRPFLRHAFLNGLLNDVNLGVQGPCKDPPTRILGSPWSPHCNLSQKWPLNNWNRSLKSKKVYSI